MAPTKDTILITGGTGFVASYCILRAIQTGYTVHATLRSRDRIDQIRQSLQNGGATWPQVKNVKFFEADLAKDEGWETACQGCGYVLHVATPVPKADPKDENDLIIPAREGTLRVLRAAKKVGTVKRVVFTSSATAIIGGHDVKSAGQTWNEEDWTDLENRRISVTSYAKSKTLAERAAWDFIGERGQWHAAGSSPPTTRPGTNSRLGCSQQRRAAYALAEWQVSGHSAPAYWRCRCSRRCRLTFASHDPPRCCGTALHSDLGRQSRLGSGHGGHTETKSPRGRYQKAADQGFA